MSSEAINVLGVMSGSSLDGFDLALCSFRIKDHQIEWNLLHTAYQTLDESLKNGLARGINQSALELKQTEVAFCKQLAKVIVNQKFYDEITMIASHGHTILHEPERDITVQIGNGGMLSSYTDRDVISDFRVQDVCLDGQGTPLVAIAERDLFPGFDFYLNLGGIANMSIVSNGDWRAFDVCPCNQVLNHFAALEGMPYDKDGRLASEGDIDHELLSHMLALPYFSKLPPKSIDNNWIKDEWIKNITKKEIAHRDQLRTNIELIVELIRKELGYAEEQRKILVTGGGAKNKFLIHRLSEVLSEYNVELVIPKLEILDFKEAILMAYLGFLRAFEKTNIIQTVTAASREVSAGAYYLAPIKK